MFKRRGYTAEEAALELAKSQSETWFKILFKCIEAGQTVADSIIAANAGCEKTKEFFDHWCEFFKED